MKVDSLATRLQLAGMLADIRAAATQAVRKSIANAKDDAKATTLFRDGASATTRRSIDGGMIDEFTGLLHAGGAAVFLENGTKPHQISAKNGGVLRFQVNGSWVSARTVKHPGTAPRPFLTHARKTGELSMLAESTSGTNEAIRRYT